MILLTGAGGKTGRAVLRELWHQGAEVRSFVRSRAHADELEAVRVRLSGRGEFVVGDLRDGDAVVEAVRSVRAIYHICPNLHPQEESIGETLIAAAEKRLVERFVYHSVLHPAVEQMPHHWRKMRVEERLFQSALDWTVLQPAAYLQNLSSSWDEIVAGELRVPYPPGTRISLVDLEDVASVASAVLLDEGHQGSIYELVGNLALTQEEAARQLGAALGREVRVVQIPLDVWTESARRAGLAESTIDDLLRMFRYYADFGFCGNPRMLRTLLGREPRSVEDFAVRLRDEKMRVHEGGEDEQES